MSFNSFMKRLQEAISSGDVDEVNRLKESFLNNSNPTTDENLIKALRGKPLYKNLKKIALNQVTDRNTILKTLSSLITHTIIESEKTSTPLHDFAVDEMYILLGKLLGEEGVEDEVQRFISSRFSTYLLD